MADNTTTYNAVIDVETKGVTDIDILNRTVKTSIGNFENLNEAVSKTEDALGKLDPVKDAAKFKVLQKEIIQLRDRQDQLQISTRKFSDALAEQPGIVGLVGGSLKGLDGGMKVLAANPIVAVVTILAGLFMTLKESLSKTERGTALLNKASEAFGKILGPIMATIEMVAFPIFEYLIGLLDKVAGAFEWLAKSLGVGTKEIEEASRASSEALKKAYEEEQKLREEAEKEAEAKRKEAAEKAKQEAEKRREEAKRRMEEAQKILLEAELSLLSKRDREIREREMRFEEEKKKLKLAGITDLTKFEEEYRQDLLELNKRYDDEELKATQDKLAKEEQLKKESAEKEKERLQKLKEAESQNRQDELNFLQADFNLRKTLGAIRFEDELSFFDKQRELQRQELVANEATGKQLIAFDKETATVRTQIEVQQQQAKLAIISNALGTLAQAVGENTVAGKALAIAQATISTYQGAALALATYPPPFGAIAAGTVIAAGLLNVRKIIATKVPAPPGTNLKGASGGGSVSSPSASVPQIQTAGATQSNTGTQIAQTIAESSQKPIQAYVVSTEVSSRQSLDRRTNSAASFG